MALGLDRRCGWSVPVPPMFLSSLLALVPHCNKDASHATASADVPDAASKQVTCYINTLQTGPPPLPHLPISCHRNVMYKWLPASLPISVLDTAAAAAAHPRASSSPYIETGTRPGNVMMHRRIHAADRCGGLLVYCQPTKLMR